MHRAGDGGHEPERHHRRRGDAEDGLCSLTQCPHKLIVGWLITLPGGGRLIPFANGYASLAVSAVGRIDEKLISWPLQKSTCVAARPMDMG